MPATDVVISGRRFKNVEAPPECTVGQWKQLLGQGSLLGDKILYAAKLVVSSLSAKGQQLEDGFALPLSPDLILVDGPGAVLGMLAAALTKKCGPPTEAEVPAKVEKKPLKLQKEGGDQELEFYCNGLQGDRGTMEDRTMAVMQLPGFSKASVFGVFDGHGGDAVADQVARRMPTVLGAALKQFEDPHTALKQSFCHIDMELKKSAKYGGLIGSTGVVLLVLRQEDGPTRYFTAHAGDSRMVLSRGKTAIELTKDHRPGTNQDERERVIAAGGSVDHQGRIDGGLNVSRGFGDFGYKSNPALHLDSQKVVVAPEVNEVQLLPGDEFFALASDGVFDALPSQDMVEMLRQGTYDGDMQKAVDDVLEEATTSGDNVALCLVRVGAMK